MEHFRQRTRGWAPILLAAAFLPMLFGPSARAAEDSKMCILSNYIEETPVIDARTILVRMNPGRGYMRIDLIDDCSPLAKGHSVAFAARVGRVCVRDSLALRQESGEACVISRIVTINADEARELLTRKRDQE